MAAKMDRVQGVRWVSLKGQGGDCGGAQRYKDPGELAGDIGRAVARRGERKGKVEPLTGGVHASVRGATGVRAEERERAVSGR